MNYYKTNVDIKKNIKLQDKIYAIDSTPSLKISPTEKAYHNSIDPQNRILSDQ